MTYCSNSTKRTEFIHHLNAIKDDLLKGTCLHLIDCTSIFLSVLFSQLKENQSTWDNGVFFKMHLNYLLLICCKKCLENANLTSTKLSSKTASWNVRFWVVWLGTVLVWGWGLNLQIIESKVGIVLGWDLNLLIIESKVWLV